MNAKAQNSIPLQGMLHEIGLIWRALLGAAFFYGGLLQANASGPTSDQLDAFYEVLTCEQKQELFYANLTSACSGVVPPKPPTPPSPTPPPDPAPPPFHSGLLPFVVVNNSTLVDSEVFVLVEGKGVSPFSSPNDGFIQFDGAGIGTHVDAQVGVNGNTYAQALSEFPQVSGGRVLYLPPIDGGIIMFSMKEKLDIPVVTGPKISNPSPTNTLLDNYSIIWDQFEVAYIPGGSPPVNVDTTAVAFFSVPLYAYLSTSNTGTYNCGLYQSRSYIFSHITSAFAELSKTPELTQWNKLLLQSGGSTIRIVSPNNGIADQSNPGFDENYLDNATTYGYSYLSDIWYGVSSFYRTNASSLKIKVPANSLYPSQTFTGTVEPGNTILFTGDGGFGDTVTFSAPATGPSQTDATTWLIFAGKLLGTASDARQTYYQTQVSKAFTEAVIAGIIPTTALVDASTNFTLSAFKPYYQINTNLSPSGQTIGPWYDLYSSAIHKLGLIYTYAYDEPLWPSVLLAGPFTEGSTYVGITIGSIQ